MNNDEIHIFLGSAGPACGEGVAPDGFNEWDLITCPKCLALRNADDFIDRYLTIEGPCTVVRGLPEEVVAMLFAFFSRSKYGIKDTLRVMIQKGDLEPPPAPPDPTSERSRKFHERMTIGYGHKSVADHAQVHWCLEGVSAIVERDVLSSRLVAASSKSTRFVNFRDAGFVVPQEWPSDLKGEYIAHCEDLLNHYESLVPLATDAMRTLTPYEGPAKEVWEKERGWEKATEKRALDMVRDLLPASVKTNFGVTCSATALREILDKRQTPDDRTTDEVRWCAESTRRAARSVLPTLIPEERRTVPRYNRPESPWIENTSSRSAGPVLWVSGQPCEKSRSDLPTVPAPSMHTASRKFGTVSRSSRATCS